MSVRNDPTAFPTGDDAWILQRGLRPWLMDWMYPEDADDHDPITEGQWRQVLAMLERAPVNEAPPLILLAMPDDERITRSDVAGDEVKRQAVRTALVTACRLHDALVDELLTARALLADLGVGDAG